MTTYVVSATLSFIGHISINADSEAEAIADAEHIPARDWDYDSSTGEIKFDITPAVEPA